jgi:regulator of replication initiation timing
MQEISREYLLLFNAISDTEDMLLQLYSKLISVQRKAEELYMEGNEINLEQSGKAC